MGKGYEVGYLMGRVAPLEVARGRNEGIEPVILCLAGNAELFRQAGFTAGEETLGNWLLSVSFARLSCRSGW